MRLGVDLQKQVWGYTDIDTVPDQMFIVARESWRTSLVRLRSRQAHRIRIGLRSHTQRNDLSSFAHGRRGARLTRTAVLAGC